MEDIIKQLIENNQTISTMESCTGGCLANEITNIKDSSKVFKFGAVTYSNEYKIKMGVDENIINTYSVYSIETSHEMSKKISLYTNSDYGVGITGKLYYQDNANPYGSDNKVFVSVYSKKLDKYFDKEIEVEDKTRKENKELIIKEVIVLLKDIIKE